MFRNSWSGNFAKSNIQRVSEAFTRQSRTRIGNGILRSLACVPLSYKCMIYGLLTKRDIKILAKFLFLSFFFFLACLWPRRSQVPEHAKKRTRPISSHFHRTSLVNIVFIVWHQSTPFSWGIQLVIPSGEDRAILPRVAHDGAGFGPSCPLSELAIYKITYVAELARGTYWTNIDGVIFFSLIRTKPQGRSINLPKKEKKKKKERNQHSPIRTEQALSIMYLLSCSPLLKLCW